MALTSGSKEPVVDGCPGIKDGHSCFAHALLGVLQDNNKVLESAALFLGIRKQVASNTKQMPKFGIIYGAGDDGGDFLFVKK